MRSVGIASLGLAIGGGAHAASVTRIAAAPARDGWFVCDAVTGPYAAFAGAVVGGHSTVTLLDRRTGRFDTQDYAVGEADHGAGQVYWSLSQGGREVGRVHGINPGMVAGSDGIAPIKGVTIAGKDLRCRWLGGMRFLGVDSRRGVVVTGQDGGFVYQSFDFARRGAVREMDEGQTSNAPTLRIAGGTRTDSGDYRFVNKGFVYLVSARDGRVTVSQAGRTVNADRFVGFSIPAGGAVALGPDAVWDGAGVDACRRRESQAALRACVADAMTAARVSPAGLAFAQGDGDAVRFVSDWRQAGPVGIATVTYPFRANTNMVAALIPAQGAPILVDDYPLTPADKARDDYRAVLRAHPGAWPVAPGDVSAPKVAAGQPITIRVRTRLATCHACAAVGSITVAYRFDAQGRPTGQGVERVEG